MSYSDFIAQKRLAAAPSGFDVADLGVPLFDHQRVLTSWALRRGKAAIFADTGLGKTRMQLAWAHHVARRTGQPVLILAPLAVADQTCGEADEIGVNAAHDRDESGGGGIRVTNYDRLHKFDTSRYAGVVLDESSIIKHHDSKTLARLMEAFALTPYKLCATATPAPNDYMELGTHAEFLGIKSRAEMLAEFFTHDGGETQKWRLKGHARALFWRWVASWGAMIRSPADLGFDATAYELPAMHVTEHLVEAARVSTDTLFELEAQTLSERRDARRASVDARADACAEIVNDTPGPWIVWCELNAEADALRARIPDAVEVRGTDDASEKEAAMLAFAKGNIRVLITKPKIAGFGMNWQHCAQVAFVGVTDSFESYYQAIRRCWRFGQDREVSVHVFASSAEGAVVSNLRRKEAAAHQMFSQLSEETREAVHASVIGVAQPRATYKADASIQLPGFL